PDIGRLRSSSTTSPSVFCGEEPISRHFCDRPRRLHRDGWPSSRIGWLWAMDSKISASDCDRAGCGILDLWRRGADVRVCPSSPIEFDPGGESPSCGLRLASIGLCGLRFLMKVVSDSDLERMMMDAISSATGVPVFLQCTGGPPPHPTCGWFFDAMILLTVEDEVAEGDGFHFLMVVFCLGSCQGFIQVAAAVGGFLPSCLRVVHDEEFVSRAEDDDEGSIDGVLRLWGLMCLLLAVAMVTEVLQVVRHLACLFSGGADGPSVTGGLPPPPTVLSEVVDDAVAWVSCSVDGSAFGFSIVSFCCLSVQIWVGGLFPCRGHQSDFFLLPPPSSGGPSPPADGRV
ncbi:hypothetical protein Dimus_037663, partial [Dionaea muscipula]